MGNANLRDMFQTSQSAPTTPRRSSGCQSGSRASCHARWTPTRPPPPSGGPSTTRESPGTSGGESSGPTGLSATSNTLQGTKILAHDRWKAKMLPRVAREKYFFSLFFHFCPFYKFIFPPFAPLSLEDLLRNLIKSYDCPTLALHSRGSKRKVGGFNFALALSHNRSDHDFGNLYCWAENSKGTMTSPCVVQVIPAGVYMHAKWSQSWAFEVCGSAVQFHKLIPGHSVLKSYLPLGQDY